MKTLRPGFTRRLALLASASALAVSALDIPADAALEFHAKSPAPGAGIGDPATTPTIQPGDAWTGDYGTGGTVVARSDVPSGNGSLIRVAANFTEPNAMWFNAAGAVDQGGKSVGIIGGTNDPSQIAYVEFTLEGSAPVRVAQWTWDARIKAPCYRITPISRQGGPNGALSGNAVLWARIVPVNGLEQVVRLALTLNTLATPLARDSFYVSTTGSDSNAGTSSAPWATIQKATASCTDGSVVYVDPGVYTETIGYQTYRFFKRMVDVLPWPERSGSITVRRTARNVNGNSGWRVAVAKIRFHGFTFDMATFNSFAGAGQTSSYTGDTGAAYAWTNITVWTSGSFIDSNGSYGLNALSSGDMFPSSYSALFGAIDYINQSVFLSAVTKGARYATCECSVRATLWTGCQFERNNDVQVVWDSFFGGPSFANNMRINVKARQIRDFWARESLADDLVVQSLVLNGDNTTTLDFGGGAKIYGSTFQAAACTEFANGNGARCQPGTLSFAIDPATSANKVTFSSPCRALVGDHLYVPSLGERERLVSLSADKLSGTLDSAFDTPLKTVRYIVNPFPLLGQNTAGVRTLKVQGDWSTMVAVGDKLRPLIIAHADTGQFATSTVGDLGPDNMTWYGCDLGGVTVQPFLVASGSYPLTLAKTGLSTDSTGLVCTLASAFTPAKGYGSVLYEDAIQPGDLIEITTTASPDRSVGATASPGYKGNLNGSKVYTVASVQSATQFTLTTAMAPNQSGLAWLHSCVVLSTGTDGSGNPTVTFSGDPHLIPRGTDLGGTGEGDYINIPNQADGTGIFQFRRVFAYDSAAKTVTIDAPFDVAIQPGSRWIRVKSVGPFWLGNCAIGKTKLNATRAGFANGTLGMSFWQCTLYGSLYSGGGSLEGMAYGDSILQRSIPGGPLVPTSLSQTVVPITSDPPTKRTAKYIPAFYNVQTDDAVGGKNDYGDAKVANAGRVSRTVLDATTFAPTFGITRTLAGNPATGLPIIPWDRLGNRVTLASLVGSAH